MVNAALGSNKVNRVELVSEKVTFLPAGTVITASGTASGNYYAPFAHSGVLFINVTAFAGTSIVFNFNSVDSISGGVYKLASSSTITAAGFYTVVIPEIYGDTFSLSYTVTGASPSITCSVGGVFKG